MNARTTAGRARRNPVAALVAALFVVPAGVHAQPSTTELAPVLITGSRLPAPLFKAVDMLALASAPVALFVIGGTLAGARVRGMFGDVAVITVGKLLLHPAAVLVAGGAVATLISLGLGFPVEDQD